MTPTEAQRRYLEAIDTYHTEHGYAPSIRELGDMLGIKSKNGISEMLDRLQRHGYLTRTPGVARSIALTHVGHAAIGVAS